MNEQLNNFERIRENIINKYPQIEIQPYDITELVNNMQETIGINKVINNKIEELHLKENPVLLFSLFEDMKTMATKSIYFYKSNQKLLKAKYDPNVALDDKVELIGSIDSYYTARNFDEIYMSIFNENEIHSPKVISKLIERKNAFFPRLLSYLKEDDRKQFIKDNYLKAYTMIRQKLTPSELEYVINKIRETDEIYLGRDVDKYNSGLEAMMVYYKSNLLNKLKTVYGKSYVEKTGKSLDDDDEFVYTMLNSKVLEQIFTTSRFDVSDADIVRTIIAYFEDKGKDMSKIRQRVEIVKSETARKERSLYNFISQNKNNDEVIDDILTKYGINKDNFFRFVKTRKFLDKKLKSSLILTLASHYKTNVVSVYDILEMIQEASEKELTLIQLLNERKIDTKIFNKAYKQLEVEQPEIYELINSSIEMNKKDPKQLISLYNSINNDIITNINDFINKYNMTPEELLNQFNNSSLYDKVYEKILTWYDFKDGLPEIKQSNGDIKK